MRLSLAITGLAAVGAQAACKGRTAGSSSATATTAASSASASSGVVSTAKNSTAAASSSVSSSAAASSSTANVKTASVSKTASNSGIKGFNYGAFFLDYTAVTQNDFEYEFERAADLPDTSGWNSARLYTMSKL